MGVRKIAVITGALKGLGFETAKALARQDYRVILTGRDDKRGASAKQEFSKQGLEAAFMNLDVSKVSSIEKFCDLVLKDFHQVDVLVNNAGVFLDEDRDLSLEEEARLIEETFVNNSLGAYLLCRGLIPQMMENGYGRVVNVSSGMGGLSQMQAGYPAYRISKTAMNAVTTFFAAEAKGTGVLVNSVCPGWVKTDMGGANATRTLEEGIKGIVWAATLPAKGPTGGFFRDGKKLEF